MDTEQQPQLTKKERRELKRQTKEAERVQQLRTRKTKKYLTKVFVVLVILVAGFGFWQLLQQTAVDSAELLQIKNNDWTKGNKNASVILIEYLDFECEACGAYYPLVKRLSEEYSNEVLFVSRYFPLPGHKNGLTAALAIEAAGKQGKYWEMQDLLFEEQQSWGERRSSDPSIFEQYAEQLGLNIKQFKQDVDSEEVKDRVIGDKNAGNRLGVNSTPTFFLNGKKIQNPGGYEVFKSLLDNALEQ